MQGIDALSSAVNAALSCAVLLGLGARGRDRACWSFAAYVGFGLLARILTWAFPGALYQPTAWLAVDLVQTLLRVAIGVELAWAIYGRLPGGAAGARALLLAFAVGTLLAAVVPPPATSPDFGPLYPLWLRLSQAGYVTALALVATLGLAARAGLPTDPFHRAIAAGLVLFLVAQVLRPLLLPLDSMLPLGRGAVMKLAYPTILILWARAAWRADQGSELSPVALRALQPWRRPA